MKKKLALTALFAVTLIVSSCATSNLDKKIDQEIQGVSSSEARSIPSTVKEQINSSALTAEQKQKLMALEEKAHIDHQAVTAEIEKAKVVLIQTIMSPKMNQREFAAIKKKITALDKQRLNNGFRVAEEVRKIINPTANTEEREIYKAVIENRLKGF